jgi:hypothetical protein
MQEHGVQWLPAEIDRILHKHAKVIGLDREYYDRRGYNPEELARFFATY